MYKLITAAALMMASVTALAGVVGDLDDLENIGDPAVIQKKAPGNFTGLVGIGVLSHPEYIGSDKEDTAFVPLINVSYKDTVYLDLSSLGAWFWKSADTSLRIGVLARSRRGWEQQDDPVLSGMGDRDDSIEAGLNVAWRYAAADVEVGYLTDISNDSDGNSAYFNLGYMFVRTPQWRLRANLNLEYVDDDVTSFYWGVPPSLATAGRPAYSPDAAWNTTLGLTANYAISEKWNVAAGATYNMLGDEIGDSPIVKDDNYYTIFAGLGWKF
jgi:outer membrane protein